ncbi:hypothetical protein [Streptomyces sp. NBC_01217]|uniref:hypothetical protein n=1 Tax=Streptomyces sp. NBC_01217 TaxID=2903779 RepID=UPI002E10DA29|nr:hypothetical protein OG507_21280 [Streptomyces sp. NBC_01217]
MRRQILDSTGRRGTLIAASAAVLCLGGALAACADGTADDGYVAIGAAGAGPERVPSGAGAPSGKVTLVPLDRGGAGSGSAAGPADGGGSSPTASASGEGSGGTGAEGSGAARSPGAEGGSGGAVGSTGGTGGTGGAGGTSGSGGAGVPDSPGSGSTAPATPSAPGPTAPAEPAVLVVGAPERAAADQRWCEKVTVEFRNTGGSPAGPGTVTFATHIIGALGIDWATIESSAPLPAPIDAGAARTKTYTVCVDAWRVPLGMHVETRDVTAVLK